MEVFEDLMVVYRAVLLTWLTPSQCVLEQGVNEDFIDRSIAVVVCLSL